MNRQFELPPVQTPQLSNLEKALAAKGNEVYLQTKHLEDADPIGGQRARKIASLIAQREMYENWPNTDEKQRLSVTHPAKDPYLTVEQGL